MNLLKRNTQQGFTIIEVVLVLAIAGLIFLMIFIAFPALQRNQADGQRRTDVGRVISQLTQYQTDNRGSIPSSAAELVTFRSNYLTGNGETFKDPAGDDYDFRFVSGATGSAPTEGQVLYHYQATCTNGGGVTSSTARKVAVRVKLAGGAVYCQNN